MWYRESKKHIYSEKHTSAIIALKLPSKIANQLEISKNNPLFVGANIEDASNLHITLVYLGKANDLKAQKNIIKDALELFALTREPISGIISGLGVFQTGEDYNPLYASYDSPDLPKLRHDLVELMEHIGVDVDETHGFTPHITLAYLPKGFCPAFPLIEEKTELEFPSISLFWSDHKTDFKLKKAKS